MDNVKEKENSFAKGLNIYKLFWIFYIGCFAGVVVETIWCLLKNHRFEYRTALILEPLNPVYGVGAIIITLCLIHFKDCKNIIIYLASFIIGGLFECCCSIFQEKMFGIVSWNYTKQTLGILGNRTSLIYCLFWGFLGICWIKVIYPYMSQKIEKLPNKLGKILTWIFAILVSFDIVFSSAALLRQRERRNNIPATSNIDNFFDEHFDDDTLKHFYHNVTVKK